MADPSSPSRSYTNITDLDMDSLTQCASYLSLQDITNMAMSCKLFNRVAYSDSIWEQLYRHGWPSIGSPLPMPDSRIREAYISKRNAICRFSYFDPLTVLVPINVPPHYMMWEKNKILFSQGPVVGFVDLPSWDKISVDVLGLHTGRVTCMRSFPSTKTSGYRTDSERDDNMVITSSCDKSIRLWWKGGNRCFKGHTGPVLTLSDRLLGDGTGKIFASGGEDRTVRLWSLSSTGRRGQHALRATLYGHDKAVAVMSVAGHKTSLLVSISKNGKVRVWDTDAASSSIRSSCCVGMTSVPCGPIGMKCDDSLLYVAAGSSVTTVDLRTMHTVSKLPLKGEIHSFEVLPSKSLFCTGETARAMLWDFRKLSDKLEPTAELDEHVGPVKHLYMDPYKILTGGPDDPYVKIWDVNTGSEINFEHCSDLKEVPSGFGCSAMAVNGSRFAAACGCRDIFGVGIDGNIRISDYDYACFDVA